MEIIKHQVKRLFRPIPSILRSPRTVLFHINKAATRILKRYKFFFIDFDRVKAKHSRYRAEEEHSVNLRRPSEIPYKPGVFPRSAKPAARELFEFRNAIIVGPAATAIFNGRILVEANSPSLRLFYARVEDFVADHALTYMFARTSRRTPSLVSISAPIFPLVPFYGQFYYEWMLEYLPKLRILDQYKDNVLGAPTILIKAGSPPFVRKSLELLGYRDHIFEWNGHPTRTERLLFTQHRIWDPNAPEFCPSCDDITWLRDRIHQALLASPQEDSPERIYISRSKATRGRRIVNEDDFADLLAKHGFATVYFEDLSFSEGMRIASHAKVILGPHGAGLANAIFGRNSTLIEIHTGSPNKPHFFALSEMMGLDYHAVPSKSVGNDLCVDVSALEKFLERIG